MKDYLSAKALPKSIGNKFSEQLMWQQSLALALEKLSNKALSLNVNDNSALVSSALVSLEGKQLTIALAELAFPLSFHVFEQQIIVNSLTQSSDCIITTNFNAVKELKQNQQLTELIKQDKLDIVGDLKVAQQFASFAQNLKIDWQSEVAKHIGGFATYKLGRITKNIVGKLNFLQQQIQTDSSEWLVHEKKLIITKSQLNHFNLQVSLVNEQADELTKRLLALEKRLAS